MAIFWQFLRKKWQFSGNFWTFNWQFSGGSASDTPQVK